METTKIKAIFEMLLVISLSFIFSLELSSLNSPSVVAEDDVVNTCCKETNDKKFCVSGLARNLCKTGFSNTGSCESVRDCNSASFGCCAVSSGVCNSNVPKLACDAISGAEFTSGKACSELTQCRKACCTFGTQCNLKYKSECDAVSGSFDESIVTDSACSDVCHAQDTGCCTDEGDLFCKKTTRESCSSEGFANGELCSRVAKCAENCKSCATKECGDDGNVYCVDGCGNREGIAHGGTCNPQGVGDKPSSSCQVVNGETKCVNWDCPHTWDNPVVDGDGGSRKNNDAWCEYQAAVGPGLDLPGTQHYLHRCDKGVEIIEGGGENRERICVGASLVFNDLVNKPTARFIDNSAGACVDCTNQQCCEDSDKNCYWIANEGEFGIKKQDENVLTISVTIGYDTNEEKFLINGKWIGGDKEDSILEVREASLPFDKVVPGKNIAECNSDIIINHPAEFQNASMRCGIDTNHLNKSKGTTEIYKYKFKVYRGGYEVRLLTPGIGIDGKLITSFSTDDIAAATEKKGMCVPIVPPAGSSHCNKATQIYPDVAQWEEECFSYGDDDKWFCEDDDPTGDNCQIYHDSNTVSMNSICSLYGDCGAKYSLTGRFTSSGFSRNCDPNGEGYNSIETECALGTSRIKEEWLTKKFDDFKKAGAGLYLGEIETPGKAYDWGYWGDVVWGSTKATFNWFGAANFAIIPLVIDLVVLVVTALWGVFRWIGTSIAGCNDRQLRDISYTCEAWQKPTTSDDCYMCNTPEEGGLIPKNYPGYFKYDPAKPNEFPQDYCTDSLCKSLGACAFESTIEGNKCLPAPDENIPPPKIEFVDAKYICNKEGPGEVGDCEKKILTQEGINKGIEITRTLNEFSSVNITLKTVNPSNGQPEYTVCKYIQSNPGNVKEFPNDGQSFIEQGKAITHTLNYADIKSNKTFNLYVYCEDLSSKRNWNRDAFVIQFKSAVEPDGEAPRIESYNPELGKAFVAYNVSVKDVTLTLDKDVDYMGGCKWSNESGVDFEKMKHIMTCSPGGANTRSHCDARLSGIISGQDNNFYFRCKDKFGHAHSTDFPQEGGSLVPYIVKASDSLNISFVKCISGDGEDCYQPIYDKSFNLSVETSGGAENGKADCTYGSDATEFFEVDGNTHRQKDIKLNVGVHNFAVDCEDIAGNKANVTIPVEIKRDNEAPKITAVYSDASSAKVNTNEKAVCRYWINNTVFNFNAAEAMSTSDGFLHSVENSVKAFKVACEDRFLNRNSPIQVYVL